MMMMLRISCFVLILGIYVHVAESIVSSQTFRMSSKIVSPLDDSPIRRRGNLMLIEESETKLSVKRTASGQLALEAPEGMTHLEVFEAFDHDHDGLIDLKEFMIALHALGYDINEDGALEYFHEVMRRNHDVESGGVCAFGRGREESRGRGLRRRSRGR